jgi:ubiquitin-conjugating enzyme E2 J2
MSQQKEYVKRLQREYQQILKDPPPNIQTHPNPDNILEWHYVLFGPKGTPYEGGVYHGKLKFPTTYPHAPPSIQMITPSGRFATNTRLCLSMSDFHPETWNPMWSVSSILTGLLSFMLENQSTTGSISTTDSEKRALAQMSMNFNRKNPTFKKMFADVLEEFDSLRASAEVTPVNNAPVNTQPVETHVIAPPVNTQRKSRGGVFLLALIGVLVLSILIAQTFGA